MNLELRVVIRQLGLLFFILSAVIAAVALFAVYDNAAGGSDDGADLRALLITALVGSLCGGVMFEAFDPAVHIIQELQHANFMDRRVGCDWGTHSVAASILLGQLRLPYEEFPQGKMA